MRYWTDHQFKDAGWKYILRYEGLVMACTISCFDAARWVDEGIGEVITLSKIV